MDEPAGPPVPCAVTPCSDRCVALRFGPVSVHLRWEELEALLDTAEEVAAARRAFLGLPRRSGPARPRGGPR